ncbi:MAG: hypothetical protein J5529_10515 [Prevotella sp.]|nr:hypothetical protein [Prevotella sp.]
MRRLGIVLIAALLVAACSSVDCPLYKTVEARYKLTGVVDTLHDSLTVTSVKVDGADVVLNRLTQATEFVLQMSYNQPSDILVFAFKDTTDTTVKDTVTIEKTNAPHFESVDCPPAFFHEITHVEWTSNVIDSIAISNAQVNYDNSKGNLILYLKPGH